MKKLFISGLFLFIGIFAIGLQVSANADINPTNISVSCASDNSGSIISWTNPVTDSLESYSVYRSEMRGALGEIVNIPVGGSNWIGSNHSGIEMSYTDTSIVSGILYYYTIKIKTLDGSQSTNTTQYSSTCGTLSIEPTNISVSCNSDNSATVVSWTNPVSEALESYFVYRSETSGNLGSKIYENNSIGSDDSGSAMSYTDSSISGGTRYYYTVKLRTVNGDYSTDVTQYSATCGTADINPTNISVSCNSDNSAIVVNWTNPISEALEQYFVYRSESPNSLGSVVNPTTGTPKNWIDSRDSGVAMSYTDSSIVSGTKYYYTVKIRTINAENSTNARQYSIACGSTPTATPIPTTVPAPTEPEDQITQINTNARLLKEGKLDSILSELKQLRNKVKEQEAEIKYLHKLTTGLQKVTQAMKDRINNFITYGVDDNTKRLGAGERAAVMNSYKSAFNKLPDSEEELADAIKIANGRWPSERSEQSELKAKAQFKKIYLRDANMDNPNDNAAVTVMSYGLRQRAENRNLDSERNGIKIFSGIYKHTPSTTDEWNIMQAITYSGASR